MQVFIHYFLHFAFPLFIAFGFYRNDWKNVYLILVATMLVDVDHILASPVFQENRYSINFHPFHTYYSMVGYMVLVFFRKLFNVIGIGLLLHMLTDLIDCLMMYSNCKDCFSDSPAIELLRMISNTLWV